MASSYLHSSPDPELQAALARKGLAAVDRLLTAQPAGVSIPCDEIGALLRLIRQAEGYSDPSGMDRG